MAEILTQVTRPVNVFDMNTIKVGVKVYYKIRHAITVWEGVHQDIWYEEGEGVITEASEDRIYVFYKGKNYGYESTAAVAPKDLLEGFIHLDILQ